ncbi:hypothetical protein F7U66_01135 [Vibrio parahaemolyticus]|nr:hypothetical protein [Vibrio parahaemolyticus]
METKKIWCTSCNGNVDAEPGTWKHNNIEHDCYVCPTCQGFTLNDINGEPLGAIGNYYFHKVRNLLLLYLHETAKATGTEELFLSDLLSTRLGYQFQLKELYSASECLIVIELLHQLVNELTDNDEDNHHRKLYRQGLTSTGPHLDTFKKEVKKELALIRLEAIKHGELEPINEIKYHLEDARRIIDGIWIMGLAPRKDFYMEVANHLRAHLGELTFHTEDDAIKALKASQQCVRTFIQNHTKAVVQQPTASLA